MKAKRIEDVLDELKSLRKKVKKATQAQAKVEAKLTQIEALVKLINLQVEAEQGTDENNTKSSKKKKAKPTAALEDESTNLAHSARQTTY